MCLRRGLLVSLLVWLFATSGPLIGDARADDATAKPQVTFSWDGRFFHDDLPHGKSFLIKTQVPKGLTFERGVMWRSDTKCDKPGKRVRELPFGSTDVEGVKGVKTITMSAPALKYSAAYCFRFTATDGLSDDKIAAIGGAVETLVKAISERQLYSAADRAEFLGETLGPLAEQTVTVADKSTTVIAWITSWTEREDRFVSLWQKYGDREQAAGKVVKQVERLRGLDLGDAQLIFATPPTALTAALESHGAVKKIVERGSFGQATTARIKADAPPQLTPAADELRKGVRTLREKADSAHRLICGKRAKASGSIAELSTEIDRLQRDVVNLEIQISAGPSSGKPSGKPKGRKERAALEQKRARLEAAKRALVERRTDRLCKNLVNLTTYSRRLDDALTAELFAAIEIVKLSRAIRDVITAKKATIPVEVVHGTRSADPTFTERATAYISADVGTVFPRFSAGNWGASLFVGVNFTFSPLDKDIPLSEDGGFGKRFSLIAGLTITEFRDDAGTVTGVAGGQAALLGVGYRISDYLRIGAGGVLFRQTHPNPAIDSQSLKVAPYVALSVDSDVAGLIKNLIAKGTKNAQ